jgi:arginyl-tRNA synthetase
MGRASCWSGRGTKGHGDLATNLAMVLAKELKQKPRDLARRVIEEIKLPSSVISKMEIAGPGFINFWLAADELSALLATILAQGGATVAAKWAAASGSTSSSSPPIPPDRFTSDTAAVRRLG